MKKKESKPEQPDNCISYNESETIEIASTNLKNLLRTNGLTAKRLAQILSETEATISGVRNQKRLPSTDFLMRLKKAYHINIDDFLTKVLDKVGDCNIENPSSVDRDEIYDYEKYVGSYYMYYLNTGSPFGKDNEKDKDSLNYGLIHIYKNPEFQNNIDYRCFGIVGAKSIEEIDNILEKLEKFKDISEFIHCFKHTENDRSDYKLYEGELRLTRSNAFLNMSYFRKDKLLAVFHRVRGEKHEYYGGLGTINSVSSGSAPLPTLQLIGTTRAKLKVSKEEIHKRLLLGEPHIDTTKEAEDIIDFFKKFYFPADESKEMLDEEDKEMIMQGKIKQCVERLIEHNNYRYAKVSIDDDKDWYKLIKEHSDIRAGKKE